jgi:hypothetical protein
MIIPRKPPPFFYPKQLIKNTQDKVKSGTLTEEQAEKKIRFLNSHYQTKNQLKSGESDPKLAAAIIELADGIPHSLVN